MVRIDCKRKERSNSVLINIKGLDTTTEDLLKEFLSTDERGKNLMIIAAKALKLINEMKQLNNDELEILLKVLIDKFLKVEKDETQNYS